MRPIRIFPVIFAVLASLVLIVVRSDGAAPSPHSATFSQSNQGRSRSGEAFLTITSSRDGLSDSRLTSDFPVWTDPQIAGALSQSLGCPSADWRPVDEDEDNVFTVAAPCELNVTKTLLSTSDRINLALVEHALAADGVSRLTVSFYIEKDGFLRCTPTPWLVERDDDKDACFLYFGDTESGRDEIRFLYGYKTSHVAAGAAILGLVLLFPVPLTFWLRSKAKRAPDEAKEVVYFAYVRYRLWGMLGAFILWWSALDLLDVKSVWAFYVGNVFDHSELLSFVLPWIVLWIPPAIVYALSMSLSAPILKLAGSERTRGEVVNQSVWAAISLVVPTTLFVAGLGFLSYSIRLAVLCFFAWLFTFFAVRKKTARAAGMELHALTIGDLRDRAFAIARKAGVKLNQVYVLPAQRLRMANAFAHSRQNILLTDYLLKNLSRREVDAIIGHEVTHLRQRLSRARGMLCLVAFGVFGFVISWLDSRVPERFPTGPVCLIPLLMGLYFISRHNEFGADAGAVKLTGDPKAMMSALVKVSRLNTMPVRWNRLSELARTHPSTTRRLAAIAKVGGIAADSIPQIVAEAANVPTETYTLPPTVAAGGKIFSTRFKQRAQAFYSWILLATYTLLPAIFARVFLADQPKSQNLWPRYIVGFAVCSAISLAAVNWGAIYKEKWLVREIRRKAAAQEAPPEVLDGLFVGLAPEGTPRLYESNYMWDVGLLALMSDRLLYWGEEARFAVERNQITKIALGPGPINWFRTPSAYISWRSADGVEKTFNFRAANAISLTKMGRVTRVLARDLQNWKDGRAAESDSIVGVCSTVLADAAASLPEPAFGEVSSSPVRAFLTRRALFRVYLWLALVSVGVSVIFGLRFTVDGTDALSGTVLSAQAPPILSGWYVLVSAWLLNTITLLPYLWYREPQNPKAKQPASTPVTSQEASPTS